MSSSLVHSLSLFSHFYLFFSYTHTHTPTYTHYLSLSLSHPRDPYAKSTSLTCQPRQITCQRSQACIRSDDVEYSYIKYLLYTYGNCILYASMYVYIYISLYVYIRMYVPPAYSRCFISSLALRCVQASRERIFSISLSFLIHTLTPSLSNSLSLAFSLFFSSSPSFPCSLCIHRVFCMSACLLVMNVSH